jgi:hypothetical protein
MYVDAAKCGVDMTLRSLHDSSEIRCAKLDLKITEQFKANIYNTVLQKFEVFSNDDAPVLYVECSELRV